MSEQIKTLISQVGTDSSGKWMSIDNVEKLAELIVQECAEICLEANDHKNILRYFGVEE
jgi:hypothetical protein